MFTFITTSNTAYVVNNGRIFRHQGTECGRHRLPMDSPVPSASGNGNPVVLNGASFGWDVKPEVGKRAVFTVKGMDHSITTSRVIKVIRW